MVLSKRILKGAVWLGASSVFVALFRYFFKVVLARNLTPYEYGLYFSVISLFSIAGLLRNLGLDYSLTKFIPEFLVEKTEKNIKPLVNFILSLKLFFSILVAIALGLLFYRIYPDVSSFPLFLFLIYFIILSFDSTTIAIYHGMHRFSSMSIINVLKSAFLLSIISLAFFLGYKTISAVALGNILTIIFIIGISLFLVYKNLPKGKFFDKEISKKSISFSFPLILMSFGKSIINNADTFMLSLMRGFKNVAVYNVSLSTANLLFFVENTIGALMMPTFSKFFAEKKENEIKKWLNEIVKFMIIFSYPIIIVFAFFVKYFIFYVFGREYTGSVYLMLVLAVGNIVWIFTSINLTLLNAKGNSKKTASVFLLGMILNVLFNYLFINLYGTIGAAIATSLSYFAMLLYSIRHTIHYIILRNHVFTSLIFLFFIALSFLLRQNIIYIIALLLVYLAIYFKDVRGLFFKNAE